MFDAFNDFADPCDVVQQILDEVAQEEDVLADEDRGDESDEEVVDTPVPVHRE